MTRVFQPHSIKRDLGDEAGHYAHLLDRLLPQLNGTEYEFEAAEEFATRHPAEMNKVYWTELLFRSHWAAAAAMVRTQRWLAGLQDALGGRNLLAAAACARGLVEAASDAEFTLGIVPSTLARDHASVTAAIEGRLRHVSVNPVLEERLIHFTHARKPSKEDPSPAYKVRQVTQYRARLDTFAPNVAGCYAYLCDLTHPGALSVLSYAQAVTPDAGRVRFAIEAEIANIEELRSRVQAIVSDVLMFGINPALVTLKLLNTFALSRLHTPAINQIDLTEIPLWQRVRAFLERRPKALEPTAPE